MKKRKVNMLALVLAGILAIGTLSACGGDSKPSESSSSETPATETSDGDSTETPATESASTGKDTIIIATENETPSVHCWDHNAVAGDYMNKLTHNGLLKPGMDLEPQLDLAESYDIISDTEWQFKLKEGVLFHDGTELTSADVKASLEANKAYADVEQYTKSIADVEIVDEYTLIIHTNGIQSSLLNDLTHHGNYIYPAHLIESGADLGTEVIGTGPYKFVAWNRGDSVEFEAFEDFFDGGEVAIKYMTWRVIPEGASRTIALENGEVDVVIEVAETDVLKLRDNPAVEMIEKAGTSHNYMMLNNEVYPFDNIDVRKALNAAINKEDLIIVALEGFGDVCDSQSPTSFAAKSLDNIVTYDPEAAMAYLEASGVDPDDIVLPIICSNDVRRRMAELIQANLAAIGINNVTVESMDLATYLDVTQVGNYTAAIGGYTADNMTGYMKGVHHSGSINASNKARLNDAEVDRLIDLAIETLDADERNEYLTQAAARVNELCPSLPLYHDNTNRAVSADLGGFDVNAAGYVPWKDVFWK